MGLLQEALEVYGGIGRWHRLKRFTVHTSIDGALLAQKGKGGLLKDIVAEGETHTQSLRITGFTAPYKCAMYRPDHVAIESLSGDILQACSSPRAAFLRHADHTPWNDLHLAYFCGCLLWNHLTVPFLLAHPDVKTEELPPPSEQGEIWHRLRAVFPASIATLSSEQIFYFDESRLQRRADFCATDALDSPFADYASAHQEFSGIVVPTLRRSLRLGPNGAVLAKPAYLDIEIFDASFA